MITKALAGIAVMATATVGFTSFAAADGGDGTGGDVTQTGFVCPGEGQSFEGYFAPSEMLHFVDCTLPYVYDFLASEYVEPPMPADVVVVPRGGTGPTGCVRSDGTQSSYSELSFHYCSGDQIVYLGEEMVWGFYEFNGDVAAMFGIAHEFGHHIQNLSGVLDLPAEQPTLIAQENQADCIAGAFIGRLSARQLLELPDDMRDVEGVINAVASAEGPDRDHGLYEERLAAVDHGFYGGLVACNDYFPALPVWVPAA